MRSLFLRSAVCLFALLALFPAWAKDLPEKDVFFPDPDEKHFPSYVKVNGRLVTLLGAPAEYVLNQVAPYYPIVGATLLPKDQKFCIDFSDKPPEDEVILQRLGDKLNLDIVVQQFTGEFAQVRLAPTGQPAAWEQAEPKESATGATPLEGETNLYQALALTPGRLLRYLNFYTDRPLLDRTGWNRGYNFLFEFDGKDPVAALRKMGLAVTVAPSKQTCIVITRRAAAPPAGAGAKPQ